MDELTIQKAEFALEQLYHLNCRISDAKARIERFREQATQSTQSFSGIGGTGGGKKSKIENSIVEAVDLETRLEKLMEELKIRSDRIIGIIDTMDREDYKRILECRYLDGMRWSRVCNCMHISHSTAFVLREKALINFAEKYEAWMENNTQLPE